MADASTSIKTITSMMTLKSGSQSGSLSDPNWTKQAISKLKSSSISDKNELQRLNRQLVSYLDNVKVLEGINKKLIDEVENAKGLAMPKIVDKSSFDGRLFELRQKLEEESNECVKYEAKIEENESLTQHIAQRLKFFQNEADIHKQKIYSLQSLLDEIRNQREYLLRSAQLAEEDINREQNKIVKAEKDLEGLRGSLKENRSRNKKIEFEMQTILEELAFRKDLFNEEMNDLRQRLNGGNLSGIDLTNFYKNELITAIRQIREDFHDLNKQQMADYKEVKEAELAYHVEVVQQEKKLQLELKSKRDASLDLETQSSKELRSSFDDSKKEMEQLSARYNQLLNKLQSLETTLQDYKVKHMDELDRKQSEIDLLKQQNDSYASELEYWERVTRTKLESEIQTYRSILNSQLKFMQATSTNISFGSNTSSSTTNKNQNASSTVISGATNNKGGSGTSSATSVTNKVTTSNQSQSQDRTKSDAISVLRKVFDHFDKDKSGTINSSEMDRILSMLDVRLSDESYNSLMREFDRDSSRDINFDEFCNIMLPVFTGKFDEEELYYAFQKFDTDRSGYISVEELKQILAKIGQFYSDQELKKFMSTVDTNNDGKLSYPEFAKLMRNASH